MIKLLALFIPYIVYLLTLPPTLTFGDSGDHIACGWILGLAHPSGYCLYTLLTHLISYIPISNIGMRMSFLTAVIASCSVFFLYLLLYQILKNKIISLSSSLVFAFSATFWNIAGYVKMYSLLSLSVILSFFIIILWEKKRDVRLLFLLAFVYGLAVSNHMLATTFGPSLLYLVFVTNKRVIGKHIGNLLLLFLLGLSVYLYLPIRATGNPVIDWGKPNTISKFRDYAFIGMAHEKMFKASTLQTLGFFKEHLVKVVFHQFTPFILILVIPGMIWFFREKRRLFYFFIITILINTILGVTVYAKISELVDMEAYHLPSFICLAIFIGGGMFYCLKKLPKPLAFIPFLCLLLLNWKASDYSRYYFAYDFGRNLIKDLPEKTVLFNRIDLDVFPLWYHQNVENLREDVAVFPIHFLRRPWFVQKILDLHPWVKTTLVDGMYEDVMKAIISSNKDRFPIYYTFFRPDERIDVPYLDRLQKNGLVYRLGMGIGAEDKGKQEHWFGYRGVFDTSVNKDVWAKEILYSYSYYHADLGQYWLNQGKMDRAITALERSLDFDPRNASYMGALGAAYGVAGRFRDAVRVLEKAVELEPNNPVFAEYLAMARAHIK
ncbi:DUF2723 domain-containing protein [bacterium]|nr:DUF2723 domain-containing protein [bacterium]MBU1598680.1 DUF2723 domain-containing protein [bacterium]